MTIAEILKAKGIDDETIKGIQEDMKANKIFTASEENLDIRYGKLKTDHDGVNKQLGEANALIEELKKSNKGNEGLQQKVADYESQIAQLQEQLKQTQIYSGLKIAFMEAGGTDIDFLIWKAKHDNGGKPLELGETARSRALMT